MACSHGSVCVSPRRWATLAIALGLAVGACKRDAPEEPAAQAAAKSDDGDTEAFARRAHAAALAEAKTLAERAFASADPLAAWHRGLGPLGPPHLAPGTLAQAKTIADKAWTEAQAIDERRLEPTDRVGLRAIRFGLQRIDLHTRERPPTRIDPGFAVLQAERTLDAIELQSALSQCAQCASALRAVAEELDAAALDLGAASGPALVAAREDLERLAKRIATLGEHTPELAAASADATARIQTVVRRFEAQRDALADAPTATWDALPPPAAGKPTLARLPDRMGADALGRWLADEEASAQPLDLAARQLTATIARLKAMRDMYGHADAGPAAVVDATPCEAVVEAIAKWAASAGVPVEAPPRCEALERLLQHRELTDAAWTVEAVRRTWVDPLATKRRRATGAAVALIGGHIAPASQRWMATIAATTGMKQEAAAALAIDDAHRAACTALAAIAVHGELDESTSSTDRLAQTCPEQTPQAWIDAAVARPIRSLSGLGLAFVESGPASAAMLDHYPWAPLGLIPVLASPPPPDPASPEPKIEIEQLQP